jgi:hypothetical protein
VGTTCAKKRTAIQEFIVDNDVDIMQLTETWLRESGDEAKCADITPSGYKMYSFPRHTSERVKRGGGIAFIVRDCLVQKCSFNATFPFPHESFEVVHMTLNTNNRRVNMVCLYRPPPSKRNKLTDVIFLSELPAFLEYCNNLSGDLVLMGDFNVHYEALGSPVTARFRDTLEMLGMTQWVTEPTHLKSKHTIDLVITRDSDQLVLSSSQRHDLTSDHSATFVMLNVPKPETAPSFVTVRCINKIDKSALYSDLVSAVTPEMPLADLNAILSQALDKHAPLVQRRVLQQKTTPWYAGVAAQLQKLKRERRRAERQWLSSKLTVHKEIYETAKHKVNDLVHSAKTAFYSAKITASISCKSLFQNLSTLLGKSQCVKLPTIFKADQLADVR